MSGKILLVEDEELVGTMVQMNLESCGYEVLWRRDGKEGLRAAWEKGFDMILLDISLPGIDGLEVLKELRRRGINCPVMMLTARSDVATKVQALESGADDYLPKPFNVREMIARVNAQVRRSQAERELPSHHLIQVGAYKLNLETREALSSDDAIVLSEKEAAIMNLFHRNQGVVLSRVNILDEVWGMEASPTERTIDNFIMRLRHLFEADPEKPKHIITVRGAGYRFKA